MELRKKITVPVTILELHRKKGKRKPQLGSGSSKGLAWDSRGLHHWVPEIRKSELVRATAELLQTKPSDTGFGF